MAAPSLSLPPSVIPKARWACTSHERIVDTVIPGSRRGTVPR
jgi:hypothetical protein